MSEPASPALPTDDTRELPLLRIGAALQGLGALPGLPILASYLWNEAVRRSIYGEGTGQVWQAAYWVVPVVALLLAPFVWTRRRWAWRASLLLSPGYALSPWLHHAALRETTGGSDPFLLFGGGVGVLAAVVIGTLYWKGRSALRA